MKGELERNKCRERGKMLNSELRKETDEEREEWWKKE